MKLYQKNDRFYQVCIKPLEYGNTYEGFSENLEKLIANNTDEFITTTEKDNPYNNTTTEWLFDLYHEKKICANIAIKPIFRP